MKKFLKIFGFIVEIVDFTFVFLKDFADDGKLNGSASKND